MRATAFPLVLRDFGATELGVTAALLLTSADGDAHPAPSSVESPELTPKSCCVSTIPSSGTSGGNIGDALALLREGMADAARKLGWSTDRRFALSLAWLRDRRRSRAVLGGVGPKPAAEPTGSPRRDDDFGVLERALDELLERVRIAFSDDGGDFTGVAATSTVAS